VEPSSTQRSRTVVHSRPGGGIAFSIPFDPPTVWGELDAFHITGTAGGHPFRGHLTRSDDAWSMQLGPSWCRAPGFGPGDDIDIVLSLEGPRSTTMGADVAAAFAADPPAARFFDSLPTFYRKNLDRWIQAATRPATRSSRIAETVNLARQGRRER
jgi:hypothetical protein